MGVSAQALRRPRLALEVPWTDRRLPHYEESLYGDSGLRLYLLGIYYTVSTIATVGFGDLTPVSVGSLL